MNVLKIAATLVGLAALGAAAERGSAQEAEAAFDRLDADESGDITRAEAYEIRTGEFMAMDSDMNGIITEDEFQGPARPLSAFDSDGDGELHLAEFLQGHRSMFERFGEDASGVLTHSEFEAAQGAARGG